jgi:hypothetical protein
LGTYPYVSRLYPTIHADVDRRINVYEKVMCEYPDRAGRIRSIGSVVYGLADESREAQIEAGMAYYRHERQRQQDIKQAIAALRAAQLPKPGG